MTAIPGTVAFDEYGRPFIILRNQEKQKRLTGTDAIKVRKLTFFLIIFLSIYRIRKIVIIFFLYVFMISLDL